MTKGFKQDKKNFNSTNESKGKTHEYKKEKIPPGGMDVCLL
jgi:hypothetical protein